MRDSGMNVLFYTSVTKGAGERLQRTIEAFVPKTQTEIYRTTDSLSGRLRQPRHNIAMCILLATTKDELHELLSIGDLLEDIRIILILPDNDEDTVTAGHRLWPRFLTYVDSDFSDIAAVLSKMLTTACRHQGNSNKTCVASS